MGNNKPPKRPDILRANEQHPRIQTDDMSRREPWQWSASERAVFMGRVLKEEVVIPKFIELAED